MNSHIPNRRRKNPEVEHQEAMRRQQLNDVKALLATEEGERFLVRLALAGGIHEPNAANNSKVYSNEGKRSLVLQIMYDAEAVKPGFMSHVMTHTVKKMRDNYEGGIRNGR